MGENGPVTAPKRRESLPAKLWRNRVAILLWGTLLLLCDLVWRTGWVHTIGVQGDPGWWGLLMAAGLLLLAAWFHFFYVTRQDNYRELIAAGKINPPEVAAAITAVKLKPKKKKWDSARDDIWKALEPKEFGKPDPGYGRRVNWAPRPLQGPLFFLWLLLLLLAAVLAMQLVSNLLDRMHEEVTIHFGGLALGWLLGALTSGFVIERRHKRIWAEIRAAQPGSGGAGFMDEPSGRVRDPAQFPRIR